MVSHEPAEKPYKVRNNKGCDLCVCVCVCISTRGEREREREWVHTDNYEVSGDLIKANGLVNTKGKLPRTEN